MEIDYHLGLIGHSDADCVLHVISEAIIGALGLGDLGTHFPDNDPVYHNKSSSYFVLETKKMLKEHNYQIVNLDLSIYLEKPILSPYLPKMKTKIAFLLDVSETQINLKATRREGLGAIGRGEGIAAECVLLIKPKTPIFKKL